MTVNKFQCPECQANLKTANPVPSGKKIRCPKCRGLFTIPGPEEEEDTVLLNGDDNGELEKETHTAPDDDQPIGKTKKTRGDEPLPPQRKKPRSPVKEDEKEDQPSPLKKALKNKRTLMLAGGGIALVLIIVLVVVVFFK